jgi:VWFA-related protein
MPKPAATLAAVLLLSGSAQAQSPPVPTFPARAEAITCDVVVLDKSGRPVRGLTRADFTLLEDGKPQAITAFEAREPATPAVAPRPAVASERVATNEDASIRGRTVAILLDDLGTRASTMQEVKASVGRWLRERADPRDEVTLATSSGNVWWSDRIDRGRDDLDAVLKRVQGGRLSDDGVSDWEAFRIAVFEDATGASGAAGGGEGGFGARPSSMPGGPPTASAGSGGLPNPLGDITGRVARRSGMNRAQVRMRAFAAYSQLRGRTEALLRATQRLSRGLAGTRGRKAILVVSEGFLHDPEQSRLIDQAIDASQRANTAIYFLGAKGLEGASFYRADAPAAAEAGDVGIVSAESMLEDSGTELLAEETGGRSIRDTNDLVESLAKVAEESSAYYLLGYQPENPPDGKWHKLQVKVARPGVSVRARRAYQASPQPAPTPEPARPGDEKAANPRKPPRRPLDPAVMTSGASDALALRLAPYVLDADAAGLVRVLVVLELETSRLSLRREGGQRKGAVDLTIVGMSRDSARTYPIDERARIEIAAAGEPGWLILSREIKLPPGVGQVRALVRDSASGLAGTASQRLEVPGLGAPYLATPVLTDRALIRNGVPRLVPVAHRRFRPRGYLFCSYEVVGMTNANGEATARVAGGYTLHAADGRIIRHAPDTRIAVALGGRVERVIALPMQGLDPGEYELVLDVVDEASGRRLTSREAFVLEPGPS